MMMPMPMSMKPATINGMLQLPNGNDDESTTMKRYYRRYYDGSTLK
jgi:hypothetical protein